MDTWGCTDVGIRADGNMQPRQNVDRGVCVHNLSMSNGSVIRCSLVSSC